MVYYIGNSFDNCTAIINTILGIIFAIYTLYCSKSIIDGVSKSKNGDCNAIVAIGDSGKETGIYTYTDGEKPLKRFKFKVK